MPILFAGLVVVPWLARSAGHLISSGLGLTHPSSDEVDPAEPELHESPVDVPPPAQTDVKGRNYNNLRLLYQKNGSQCSGLDCLSSETQQNPEQENTSVWIGSVIRHSGSNRFKLPPLSPYMSPGISCPMNVRARENIKEHDPETPPQPAGRESEETVGVFSTAQEKIQAFYSMTKAGIVTVVTILREKVRIFFANARAKTVAFFSTVQEAISSFLTEEVRLYILPSNRRLRVFRGERNLHPIVRVVFHRAESQLLVYLPLNHRRFFPLPEPEQELWLYFPGPGQGLVLYFPQSNGTFATGSGFRFFIFILPQSQQAFLLYFYGPLERILGFVVVVIARVFAFVLTVYEVIANVFRTVIHRVKLAHVSLGLGQYRVFRCVASVFSRAQERIHAFFGWIYARTAYMYRPVTLLTLQRIGRAPVHAIRDFASGDPM